MKLKIRYDLGDGPVEVETNLYVVVAWERKYKRKASDMANGFGIEDLAFMAHKSAKLNKVTVPLMLDDFIKKLAELEIVSNETSNPTNGEPTDCQWSTSPSPAAPGHATSRHPDQPNPITSPT